MIFEEWDRGKSWVQSTGVSRDVLTTQKINEELGFDFAKDVAKEYFIQ